MHFFLMTFSAHEGDDGELNREEPIGTNITVLFWNGFWLWPMMGMGAGNEGFVSAGCKMRNCYITTNRAYHQSAHAVILHGIDQGFFPAMEKFKVSKKRSSEIR